MTYVRARVCVCVHVYVQTQVAWLQGMLGLTFCSLALCAGFACLNMVNTPTRFETSKEGQ